MHFLIEGLSCLLELFELLENVELTWGKSTDATILLLVKIEKLFFFLRLKLCAAVLHSDELLHSILLVFGQVTLHVLVFLEQLGQIFLLWGRHRLLKESHFEVTTQNVLFLWGQAVWLFDIGKSSLKLLKSLLLILLLRV